MKGLLNITRTTAEQARREPIFYIITAVFGVLIFVSRYLVQFVFEGKTIKVMETCVASITACGILLSLLLSWMLIRKEMEELRILSVLSKPVSRFSFVFGKYLGLWIAVSMAMIFLFLVFILSLWQFEGASFIDRVFSGTWDRGGGIFVLTLQAFKRTCSLFFRERVLPGFIGTFSSFLTVWIILAVCSVSSLFLEILTTTGITLSFMIVGNLSGNIFNALQRTDQMLAEFFGWLVHLVLPDLSRLNTITAIQLTSSPDEMLGRFIPFLGFAFAASLFYVGVLLTAGTALFQEKEIT